jgi:hypothetical protein
LCSKGAARPKTSGTTCVVRFVSPRASSARVYDVPGSEIGSPVKPAIRTWKLESAFDERLQIGLGAATRARALRSHRA